jgi:predicted RNase H-like HicB family nuclease
MAACQLLPHQGGLAAGAPVDHRQRRCDAIHQFAPQQLPALGGVVDDAEASLGEPPARRRRAVLPTSLNLPGCVATGATVEQVERELRVAIAFHLEGMPEDGMPIADPTSKVEYIELAA